MSEMGRLKILATAAFLAILFVTTLTFVLLQGEEGGRQATTYENIEPAQAKKLIATKDPVILDVRTPDEFENMPGHIENSVLVPIDELRDSSFLKIPKDEEILVYCRSGHRSSWGAKYLAEEGYEHVYNLAGGILAWENQGYPVKKARDVENKPKCKCVVFG